MSLDVYLKANGKKPASGESKIFIREDGGNKQITRAEWDERFPGREPCTITPDDESDEVYSANITHNLNRMAEAAGIYLALWRPSEMLDPATHAKIVEQSKAGNYHGAGGVFELERTLPTPHAGELIAPLQAGLALLKSEPERFQAFNPANGWGTYEGLVRFVENYLTACIENPDAAVEVSR